MASKNAAYLFFVTLVASAYFLLIYISGEVMKLVIGNTALIFTLPAVFVFAVAYHPLMRLAQARIDRMFGKVEYESEVIAKKFSEQVKKMMTTDRLAEYTARAAYRTFRLKGAAVYLFDEKTGLFNCRCAAGSYKAHRGNDISKDSAMIRAMALDGRSLLPKKNDEEKGGFYAVIPSVMRKKGIKVQGFLGIDEKISGDPLTNEDIMLIETLSSQVSLGIENSKLYENKLDSLQKFVEVEKLSDLGKATAGVARQAQMTMRNIEAFAVNFPAKTHDKEFLVKAAPVLYAEVEKMRLLMQGVLEYSKPAAHTLRDIDIVAIALDTISLIREEAGAKGVEICFNAPDTLLLKSDKQIIKQSLLNTILNALEATGSGGKISVSISQNEKGLQMTVEDNGHGIPADVMGKIFEPFFSTKDYGIGLGLTIVRNNLKLLGGTIGVKSKDGTVVEMFIPSS